jgi:hypothetical protein
MSAGPSHHLTSESASAVARKATRKPRRKCHEGRWRRRGLLIRGGYPRGRWVARPADAPRREPGGAQIMGAPSQPAVAMRQEEHCRRGAASCLLPGESSSRDTAQRPRERARLRQSHPHPPRTPPLPAATQRSPARRPKATRHCSPNAEAGRPRPMRASTRSVISTSCGSAFSSAGSTSTPCLRRMRVR